MRPPMIANVGRVHVFDSLFVYFLHDGAQTRLGTFTIARPRLVAAPEAPAVARVADEEPVTALAGCPEDPYMRAYTGFVLEELDHPMWPTPDPIFKRNALVALP